MKHQLRDEIMKALRNSSNTSSYLYAVTQQLEHTSEIENVVRVLTSALIAVDTQLNKTAYELIRARQTSTHISSQFISISKEPK